jgi:hypothetical protein
MKITSTWMAGAMTTLTALGAWVCIAGCKGNTTANAGFEDDDSLGSDASAGNGNGSGSTGGTRSGGAPSAPSAAYADGGIACGIQAGCAPSEACCYATPATDASAPRAPGGFGGVGAGAGAAALSCVPAGSCAGSSLACSSTQHCSGGQVCCFAYQQDEAGAAPAGPAAGFGGFGAPPAFSAQCADDCPGGDMVHYQLCASSADCASGQQCIPGTYTPYCADTGGPGGPTGPQSGDDGGSD